MLVLYHPICTLGYPDISQGFRLYLHSNPKLECVALRFKGFSPTKNFTWPYSCCSLFQRTSYRIVVAYHVEIKRILSLGFNAFNIIHRITRDFTFGLLLLAWQQPHTRQLPVHHNSPVKVDSKFIKPLYRNFRCTLTNFVSSFGVDYLFIHFSI